MKTPTQTELKEKFFDILFDNQNSVVERNKTNNDSHITVLSVNGVDVIQRVISSNGTHLALLGD